MCGDGLLAQGVETKVTDLHGPAAVNEATAAGKAAMVLDGTRVQIGHALRKVGHIYYDNM